MSYIQREIDKLNRDLIAAKTSDQELQLRAAQQALVWVLDPLAFKSPWTMITGKDGTDSSISAPVLPLPTAPAGSPVWSGGYPNWVAGGVVSQAQ